MRHLQISFAGGVRKLGYYVSGDARESVPEDQLSQARLGSAEETPAYAKEHQTAAQ